MTTITMTFRQLRKLCNPKGEFICTKSAIHLCTDSGHCPIWRRAKKREKKGISIHAKTVEDMIMFIEQAHQNAAKSKLVFGPGSSGMYEKKPHPIAGDAMADYCECCHKTIKGRTYRTKDDVLLCRKCHGELANEPVGRSGTPLVRGGKIVRLPKKARRG